MPATPVAAPSDKDINRQIALVAVLGEMRERDRFGIPAQELAAWQDWAELLFAEPEVSPTLEAETRLGLAIAHFYAKQYEEGLGQVEAARNVQLPFRHRTSLPTEIDAYSALLLLELGRLDEAEQRVASALAEAEKSGLASDLALALNARANLAFTRNDLPDALKDFCKARDLGLGDGWADPGMVVTNASSCAVVHFFLQTPDTLGAVRIGRDYALANLPRDHPRMGNIYNTGYAILLRHGRFAEAEELIRWHLELERKLHDGDADDVLDPLSMLARVRERLGALEDAEELFAASAAMADRLDSGSQPYNAGLMRSNQAQVLAKLGRLAEAQTQFETALARLRADLAPDDWHIGSVQTRLGDMLGQRGDVAGGLKQVEQGLALLRAKLPDDHGEVLIAELIRGQLLARAGDKDAALTIAREAAAMLEASMFDLTAGEQEQVALERVLQPAFARYLDIALRCDDAEVLVHAAQLQLISTLAVTNARIAGARAEQNAGLAQALAEMKAARAAIEQAETDLMQAQSEGAENRVQLADALNEKRTAAEQLEATFTSRFPDWIAVSRPPMASLAELQNGLAPGAMLVLPIALPDRAVTIAITPERLVWGESAVRADTLATLSQKLREGIAVPETFRPETARAMFRHVFPGRVEALLQETDQLVFPASGYLARIPPGMLLGPASDEGGEAMADLPWLVRSHSVSVRANVGTLAIDARGGEAELASFLGFGAPEMPATELASARSHLRASLGPLPHAERELIEIGLALDTGESLTFTGLEATERQYRKRILPQSRGVLAFATHGLIGGEVAGLSEPALLMTPDPAARGTEGDGFLTASEIAALPNGYDWAILSACNTASGADGSAPAYSGLANAFAEAGVRSLMLSHWRVRDDASAFLSVETVRGAAQGAARSEALRQAQLALMARSDIPDAGHPAVWAPFVIVEN